MDSDFLAALDGLNDDHEVRSKDLEELGIPEEDTEKWSEVVNTSIEGAWKALNPNNSAKLKDALQKIRTKETVLGRSGEEG